MNFIRFNAWKGKLVSFACLIYAFSYKNPTLDFQSKAKILFFLLLGIVLGAIWASLINNYYDIEADNKAYKLNGMANVSPFTRKLSLVLSIFSCNIYCFFLFPNQQAIIFYCLGWFCFYLYSSFTFRLKEKPFLDLLTDGLASQFFPALFIFSYLLNEQSFQENYVFILSGSLWLFFANGIRALIIHQYRFEKQDRQSGLNTYVIHTKSKVRKKTEAIVLFSEILFFSIFALSLHYVAFCVPIILYATFIFVIKKYFPTVEIVYFKWNTAKKQRIFLYNLYTFFIFCILGLLCWQNTQNIIFLIFHLLFFHRNIFTKLTRIIPLKI